MTIEFADPGFNFLFVYIPLFITVFFIALFIMAGSWTKWDGENVPLNIVGALMGLSIIATAFVPPIAGPPDYSNRVIDLTEIALAGRGFTNVEVTDDRFTAATSDGEYFSGALVDLRPDSGYAYRIVELED
jgi:hypothetical protein